MFQFDIASCFHFLVFLSIDKLECILEFDGSSWDTYRIWISFDPHRYIKQDKERNKGGCYCVDANFIGCCTSNS